MRDLFGGFDILDASNTAPRARIQIRTGGGNTSAATLEPISLEYASGQWTATAESDGLTWTGTADSTMGAIIALLADRIGYVAEVRMKPEREG